MSSENQVLAELLAEGLDLCRRAREMDAIDRRSATLQRSVCPEEWVSSGLFAAHVKDYNLHNPDRPIATNSATLHVWVVRQYEADLADWERRAKDALRNGRYVVGL